MYLPTLEVGLVLLKSCTPSSYCLQAPFENVLFEAQLMCLSSVVLWWQLRGEPPGRERKGGIGNWSRVLIGSGARLPRTVSLADNR